MSVRNPFDFFLEPEAENFPCTACGHTLTPRGRDCCVFCSYADTRCPPKARNAHLAVPRVS